MSGAHVSISIGPATTRSIRIETRFMEKSS